MRTIEIPETDLERKLMALAEVIRWAVEGELGEETAAFIASGESIHLRFQGMPFMFYVSPGEGTRIQLESVAAGPHATYALQAFWGRKQPGFNKPSFTEEFETPAHAASSIHMRMVGLYHTYLNSRCGECVQCKKIAREAAGG
jgi:hypothetical protein